MKTTLFAMVAATAIAFAGPTVAESFNNNTFDLTAVSGSMDFTVSGNSNGITDLETGAYVYGYEIGAVDTMLRAAVGYDIENQQISLRGEYTANAQLTTTVSAYGSAAVEYVTANNDLADGDFLLDPNAGVSVRVLDQAWAFAEAGYTWDITNNWNRLGGYAELGVELSVSDTFAVIPSVVRELDTNNSDVNLNLQAVFVF
jgi:hypothetical protein